MLVFTLTAERLSGSGSQSEPSGGIHFGVLPMPLTGLTGTTAPR